MNKIPLVKICGLTNLRDAKLAAKLGARYLGFIFYKPSLRNIKIENARKIVQSIKKTFPKVQIVGVFVDATEKNILKIAQEVQLDLIQLHGKETPALCKKLKSVGYKVWKAIRVKTVRDLQRSEKFFTICDGILFDTYIKGKPGGTGKTFDWSLLYCHPEIVEGSFCKELKFKRPDFFILSGGLNAENISEAKKIVQPDVLDISSGVEKIPGKKDSKKLQTVFAKLNYSS